MPCNCGRNNLLANTFQPLLRSPTQKFHIQNQNSSHILLISRRSWSKWFQFLHASLMCLPVAVPLVSIVTRQLFHCIVAEVTIIYLKTISELFMHINDFIIILIASQLFSFICRIHGNWIELSVLTQPNTHWRPPHFSFSFIPSRAHNLWGFYYLNFSEWIFKEMRRCKRSGGIDSNDKW